MFKTKWKLSKTTKIPENIRLRKDYGEQAADWYLWLRRYRRGWLAQLDRVAKSVDCLAALDIEKLASALAALDPSEMTFRQINDVKWRLVGGVKMCSFFEYLAGGWT